MLPNSLLVKHHTQDAIELLKRLIETPSLSREEEGTAQLFCDFFSERNIPYRRLKNNVWVKNKHFSDKKPTILVNSHHDTVKPNASWTRNPFEASIEKDTLYGLGSNDAGASLVSLIAAFRYFYEKDNLAYNLILAATAEEEISGKEGIELIYPHLPDIDFAIVGEPTHMHMAIAEKGLLVVDCVAQGKAGHAARNEGENAIYKALDDINWLRNYQFSKKSEWLGDVKMTVSIIQAGTQHNVVPDQCSFTIDIRTTEHYSHEEILETLQKNLKSEIKPRSTRLKSSGISPSHPIVQAGLALGRDMYGSPTMSDQALLPCISLKMGVGDSARSHTADEYILLSEIEEGIELYIRLLEKVL